MLKVQDIHLNRCKNGVLAEHSNIQQCTAVVRGELQHLKKQEPVKTPIQTNNPQILSTWYLCVCVRVCNFCSHSKRQRLTSHIPRMSRIIDKTRTPSFPHVYISEWKKGVMGMKSPPSTVNVLICSDTWICMPTMHTHLSHLLRTNVQPVKLKFSFSWQLWLIFPWFNAWLWTACLNLSLCLLVNLSCTSYACMSVLDFLLTIWGGITLVCTSLALSCEC